MNTKLLESKIIIAHDLKDFGFIQSTYVDLLNTKNKMDRWFDKFLDMFDDKLSNAEKSDPIKKLYESKYNEYQQVTRTLKVAEHYMKA
jgi:hypothetical protein